MRGTESEAVWRDGARKIAAAFAIEPRRGELSDE